MVAELFDWVDAPSVAMSGMDAPLEDAIERVQARYPDRSFCVVQEWVWVEFKVSVHMVEGLALRGETPHVLIATTILHDSRERFRSGRCVRTSFLVGYESPYFVTRNTVYVLLGTGWRIEMPFKSQFLMF